jgi:hypothetical protein
MSATCAFAKYMRLNFCGLCSALMLAAFFCAAPASFGAESIPSEVPGFSLNDMRFMYNELTSTGVGRNGIGPVYKPVFMPVADAGLSMDNHEPVFVVHYPGGITRVYPQSIMVWHEVVNDVLPNPELTSAQRTYGTNQPPRAESAGNNYTISYSPLTGTIMAFKSRAGRFPSAFGNEGKLLNANLVMFDHSSGSLWSQILAACIDGPLAGKRLERYPVYWMRWGGVKNRYPSAQVLSRATGYKRSYGRDPYGSYFHPGSYYDDTRLLFPVMRQSDQLPPKERILGLEIESIYGALLVNTVREATVLNQALGIFRLVAMYDEELDRVRVFESRQANGSILEFTLFEGKIRDKNTNSEWNSDGECVYGRMRGTSLKPVLAIDSMWFAWYAFHPDTKILGSEPPPRRKGPDIPY